MNVKDLIMKLAEYGPYYTPEFNITQRGYNVELVIKLKPSPNAHNVECHTIPISESQINVKIIKEYKNETTNER